MNINRFMNTLVSALLLLTLVACTSTRTAPDSYTFAVICDTRGNAEKSGTNGVNRAAMEAIGRELKDKGAEFILAPGDFICGNVSWYPDVPTNNTQYATFLNAARDAGMGLPDDASGIPLYAVRGNHECYHQLGPKTVSEQAWIDNIGRHLPTNGPKGEIGYSYSFRFGNALFIAADQYIHALDSQKENIYVNQTWIDQVLSENRDATHVFLYGHTPAFAAHHQDCLAEFKDRRNTLMRSIAGKSGVYLCGHDHFYARGKIPVYAEDGKTIESWMQQVITPSGAPFLGDYAPKWDGKYTNTDVVAESYIDNAMGYQLITVNGKEVTVEFHATLDGCTWKINPDGTYTYTYKDDWENWKFSRLDSFSYTLP